MPDIREIVRRLGGEMVSRNSGNVPAMGHSKRDRGVSVTQTADGLLLVNVFNGGDWRAEKDRIHEAAGLPPFQPGKSLYERTPRSVRRAPERDTRSEAARVWSEAHPIVSTRGEWYFREERRIACALSPALRYHPGGGGHGPAIISAYALPREITLAS